MMDEENIRKILDDTSDPYLLEEGILTNPISMPNFIPELTNEELDEVNKIIDDNLATQNQLRMAAIKKKENEKAANVQARAITARNKIFPASATQRIRGGVENDVWGIPRNVPPKHPIDNTGLRANPIDESHIRDMRPHYIMLFLAVRQAILFAPLDAPLDLTFAERQTIATFLIHCTQEELDLACANLNAFHSNPNTPISHLDNTGFAGHEYCQIFQNYNAHHLPAPPHIVAGKAAFDVGVEIDPKVKEKLLDNINKVKQKLEQLNIQVQALIENPDIHDGLILLKNQKNLDKISNFCKILNTIETLQQSVQKKLDEATNLSKRARGTQARRLFNEAIEDVNTIVRGHKQANALFQQLMEDFNFKFIELNHAVSDGPIPFEPVIKPGKIKKDVFITTFKTKLIAKHGVLKQHWSRVFADATLKMADSLFDMVLYPHVGVRTLVLTLDQVKEILVAVKLKTMPNPDIQGIAGEITLTAMDETIRQLFPEAKCEAESLMFAITTDSDNNLIINANSNVIKIERHQRYIKKSVLAALCKKILFERIKCPRQLLRTSQEWYDHLFCPALLRVSNDILTLDEIEQLFTFIDKKTRLSINLEYLAGEAHLLTLSSLVESVEQLLIITNIENFRLQDDINDLTRVFVSDFSFVTLFKKLLFKKRKDHPSLKPEILADGYSKMLLCVSQNRVSYTKLKDLEEYSSWCSGNYVEVGNAFSETSSRFSLANLPFEFSNPLDEERQRVIKKLEEGKGVIEKATLISRFEKILFENNKTHPYCQCPMFNYYIIFFSYSIFDEIQSLEQDTLTLSQLRNIELYFWRVLKCESDDDKKRKAQIQIVEAWKETLGQILSEVGLPILSNTDNAKRQLQDNKEDHDKKENKEDRENTMTMSRLKTKLKNMMCLNSIDRALKSKLDSFFSVFLHPVDGRFFGKVPDEPLSMFETTRGLASFYNDITLERLTRAGLNLTDFMEARDFLNNLIRQFFPNATFATLFAAPAENAIITNLSYQEKTIINKMNFFSRLEVILREKCQDSSSKAMLETLLNTYNVMYPALTEYLTLEDIEDIRETAVRLVSRSTLGEEAKIKFILTVAESMQELLRKNLLQSRIAKNSAETAEVVAENEPLMNADLQLMNPESRADLSMLPASGDVPRPAESRVISADEASAEMGAGASAMGVHFFYRSQGPGNGMIRGRGDRIINVSRVLPPACH